MKFPKLVLAFGCFVMASSFATSKEFPERPVKLIVPYAAGGTTDALARNVAHQMSKFLNQPVIVENVAGAGGNLGAMAVLNQSSDGHTMLFMGTGHLANKYIYEKMSYDALADFVPLSKISVIPNVLVVNPKSGIQSVADLLGSKKLRDGEMNYGSAGSGTTQHLSGSLFSTLTGSSITHVPYKGGAPALSDLMAGRIDMTFSPIVEVLPFIEAKKLRALAITDDTPSAALPDVAPLGQFVKGYKNVFWNALVLKKGTDAKRIDVLHGALMKAFADKDAVRDFQKQGASLTLSTPTQLSDFLVSEVPKIKYMVELSGAKAN